MATYCISDIHGHKDELDEMLTLIKFCPQDTLYVLGDVLDKGPKSAECLLWATSAPDNIHFLRGNHEDFAYPVLSRDPVTLTCLRRDDLWLSNGASETLDDLEAHTSAEWRMNVLLPWMEKLLPFTVTEVGGKPFALVHAGFDPYYYDLNLDEDPEHAINMLSEVGWPDPGCLTEKFDIGHLIGVQDTWSMMWIRQSWIFSERPAPIDTVYGHSVTTSSAASYARRQGIDPQARGGDGTISHILNRHGIDCGCAYGYIEAKREHFGVLVEPDEEPHKYALGCLRLDDMAEFYVPLHTDRYIFD